MLWFEKLFTLFNGLDVLDHHESLGKIVLRAPAVSAKIRCLFIFYVTLRSAGLYVRVVHSSNDHCVAVYESILSDVFNFFQNVSPIHVSLHQFTYSLLDGATIFAKLRSKIAKSPTIC